MVSFFHTSFSTFFIKASKSHLFNYIWASHRQTAKLIHGYSFPFWEKPTIKLFKGIWMNDWHHIQFGYHRDFKKFNSTSNLTGRRTRHIQFRLSNTSLSGFQGLNSWQLVPEELQLTTQYCNAFKIWSPVMGWEIETNCMSSEETCTVNQWHNTCSPNNTPEQLFVADLVVLTRRAYQRTNQERQKVSFNRIFKLPNHMAWEDEKQIRAETSACLNFQISVSVNWT
jgi:hypothetical protein